MKEWLQSLRLPLLVKDAVSPDTVFVIDIGTELLKVLIVHKQADHVDVLGVGRARQPRQAMDGGWVADLSAVEQSLEQALQQAITQAGFSPHTAIMGIAGNTVRSLATTITHKRDHHAQAVDLNELKNIFKHLYWQSADKIRQTLIKELHQPELDVRLIHTTISDIALDNRKVISPVGLSGREIEVSAINSYAPLSQLSAISKTLVHFKLRRQGFYPQAYAVAHAAANGTDLDGIIVDIGGGTTDVGVVIGGGVVGVRSFNIAGRSFTERLMYALELEWQEAESTKLAYAKNLLNPNTTGKIESMFLQDAAVWMTGVGIALKEILHDMPCPHKIFLCGGGSQLPDIGNALRRPTLTRDWPLTRRLQATILKPSDISQVHDTTNSLVDAQDTTPMALATMLLTTQAPDRLSQLAKSYANPYI